MRRRRGADGFSLIEMTIVVSVLLMMAAVGSGLVVQSNNAHRLARDMNRATEFGQKVIGHLERELVACAALYTNDALGNAYRAILELPAAAPPLDTTVLPTIDVTGRFEKESATGAKTGNAILFARHAWTTDFRCTSGSEYRIDVYRLVYWYLTRTGEGPRSGSPNGVTLCEWVSEPMADADQVDAVTDPTELGELLAHLAGESPSIGGNTHDAIQLVWRRHDDPTVTGTLRQIDPASRTLDDTPLAPRTAPWRLLADPNLTDVAMLSARRFGVASNGSPRSFGVGTFSVTDESGDGFPHGLEVQVVGESFNRQLLVQMVLVRDRPTGPYAHLRTRALSVLPVR